jgi:hypothetical protein
MAYAHGAGYSVLTFIAKQTKKAPKVTTLVEGLNITQPAIKDPIRAMEGILKKNGNPNHTMRFAIY